MDIDYCLGEFDFPGYFWVNTDDYSMLANEDGDVVAVVYDWNQIIQD
ncbi:hypothetical protein NVP1133O_59 [Vibrio phage 1.133.O._10N.222.51.E4]|nr:hypothetical protein NVP1131O_60 [Vibrio phage 1.131.O._10N.222.49.A8]AUR89860.1 hypothetical protein NVP1133O_59 [Vibrio phage 1.133.O._10N.222.51.E4]